MNYLHKSLFEIHDAITRGEINPLDLVLEAIRKAKNDTNNAFEYISEQEALKRVNELDPSLKDNVFYGIPVVIKDNFSTKDIPTTGSSNLLKDYIPIFSAEAVNRLEKAGAVIIGKTTLDELAMGGKGVSGHLGPTYNPWDKTHKRMVGGSSSGSAAAISAGIVPFALGSDTGDSVRKPASYAGLVGFKPTWGRISRFGLFSFAASMDHVAYFTRNVMDSAISLSILAGRDEKDDTSSLESIDDYVEDISKSIKGKRIAVIQEVLDSIHNQVIISTFKNLIEKLKEAGSAVEFVHIDIKLLRTIYPSYMIISSAEAGSNYACLDGIKYGIHEEGKTYEEMVMSTRTKGFSPYVKRRFVIGAYSLLKENTDELFVRAQKCRRVIVDAFKNVLNDYDAICMPATPSVARNIDYVDKDILSDEYLIADNYMAYANFGGFPSITVPLGFEEKMPFGVNVTANLFKEKDLFNIAFNIEKITGLKDLVALKENE